MYQALSLTETPKSAGEDAKVKDEKDKSFHRMNIIWECSRDAHAEGNGSYNVNYSG